MYHAALFASRPAIDLFFTLGPISSVNSSNKPCKFAILIGIDEKTSLGSEAKSEIIAWVLHALRIILQNQIGFPDLQENVPP